jgi:hypothetical protein
MVHVNGDDTDDNHKGGYDVRAMSRRRPKEENEQPLFLRKAYSMIETCPPHLGITIFYLDSKFFLTFIHFDNLIISFGI